MHMCVVMFRWNVHMCVVMVRWNVHMGMVMVRWQRKEASREVRRTNIRPDMTFKCLSGSPSLSKATDRTYS